MVKRWDDPVEDFPRDLLSAVLLKNGVIWNVAVFQPISSFGMGLATNELVAFQVA